MTFPPASVAANKTNGTGTFADHPSHHNQLALAVNDITARVTSGGLSVRDYGAVGDGVTDDTAAIQATIDAAAASQLPVLFGSGTFRTTSTVYFKSRQTIRGDGVFLTVLRYEGSGIALAHQAGTRVYEVVFSDFTVLDAGSGTVGISWDALSLGRLTNVRVDGFATGIRLHGGQASGSSSSLYNQFYALEARNCGVGVAIEEQSNSNSFWGCRFDSCTVGMKIIRANHIVVTGSAFENNSTFGLLFDDVASPHIWLNSIIANRFELNGVAWETSTTTDQTVFLANHYDGNDVNDQGTKTFRVEARGLAFWSGAGYTAGRPSVTGSDTRVVLDNLLTVLDTYGLISDDTTAP